MMDTMLYPTEKMRHTLQDLVKRAKEVTTPHCMYTYINVCLR